MRVDSEFGIIIAGHVVVDEIIDRPGQFVPRRALGGAPSYSSFALASLGYKPEIVTRIGDDFPDEYARLIKERTGINVYQWIAPGFKTTSYRIDRSGEHRRLWLAAKCRDLGIEDFRAYLTDPPAAKAIVLNPVVGEISLSLLERISKEFELVFVDSQGFVRRFDKKTGEVGMRAGLDISALAGVDVLVGHEQQGICDPAALQICEYSSSYFRAIPSGSLRTRGAEVESVTFQSASRGYHRGGRHYVIFFRGEIL
jgi:hypothetical protein